MTQLEISSINTYQMKYLHILYSNGRAEIVAYPNGNPELPNRPHGYLRVERSGQSVKWVNLATVSALTVYENAEPKTQKVIDIAVGASFAGLFGYAALMARGKQQLAIAIGLLMVLAIVQLFRHRQ